MSTALHESGRNATFFWLVLLLVTATALPASKLDRKPESHHLQIGVEGAMPTLIVAQQEQQQQQQQSSPTPPPPLPPTTTKTTTTRTTMGDNALNVTKANFEFNTTTTTLKATTEQTTKATTTLKTTNIYSPVVHLLDLEQTVAPPIHSGHDGEKFTRKKQLQQENYPTTRPTTFTTTTIESEMERIPTSPTTSTTTTLGTSTTSITPKPKHNGYLGPIFMGEKTFSVLHPLKKPKQEPPSNNNNNNNKHVSSIESQLRNGRIVEILAPTALLEQNTADSTIAPPTAPPASLAASSSSLKLSTTVFQVAADMQTSTSTATSGPAEETLASLQAQLPPRTESKISDIQIEVYDSTVDSIVASTNFRDNEGYYARPAMDVGEAEETGMGGTTKPPTQPMIQERFTQYVIDRADVSTQPAAGLGKQVPAAIEIHINVSEALGGESEDLEFSYRQPSNAPNEKSSKLSDEILVVEIIDNGDNSTENSASGSAEHINPIFTFRSDAAIATPQVRPPQLPQDAQDELFMADVKGDVPRPPPPPPPPPPRKPSAIDRDSDTIFYISNTEVKVGESLPTVSSAGATLEQQQQRKMQLENQFFPANYMMERTSVATPRYEEDIILSPLHHNAADTLKIFRSGSSSGNTGDGAPPLDVTYVGESVIEVEQQSPAASQSTTMRSLPSSSSPMPDIIIQPAVLPDLAIGVPVIGELPPQIELKEIDYMPGELGLSPNGIGIYENEIQGNSLTMDTDSESEPDVIESSIQYGGDLIDDGAGGGFDGVEGSYPFDSPAHRMQQAVAPHHHHLHRENEPMAEMLNATLLQHNDSGAGASAMAPLLANGSQMPERMGNATALSEDPSNDFDGFLNLFAVSMGLIIVILPSALLVSMYCAVRYMLNKNTATGAQGDDSEQGQDSAKNESPSSPSASSASSGREAPAIHTIHRHHQHVMAHCVQPIRFQFEQDTMINTIDPALSVIRDTVSDDNVDDPLKIIGPYGSITKMTLKDNHLIIVTEERHDISRNARETKMHTDKDGVFVVEVARGIDSKQMPPDSPGVLETTELPFDTKQQANGLHVLNEQSLPPSHEQVQIHAPPIDFANSQPASAIASMVGGTSSTLHLIEEEEQQLNDPELESDQNLEQDKIAQTGLSQSDLSSTSSGDSNKRYTYGNQELYIIEQPGYATISPTAQPIIPNPSPPTEEVSNNNNEKEKEQEQQPAEEAEPQIEPKPEPKPQAEPQRESQPEQQSEPQSEPQLEPQSEPQLEPQLEPQSETQTETLENIAVPPAAFGNYHQADETDDKGDLKQEDNTYDSLMSLPAPPSTEEIKELNDFTLIESNQLDSLPPPPPPPPTDANGNGQAKTEEQFDAEAGATISNGNGNDNATSKVVVPVASVSVCVTQPSDEPTTLTPPASPPATPPPQPPATIYGSGNGQLTNGIIHPMPVDVNGS